MKMAIFDITQWFEQTFWPTYPRDLCNDKPGSKSKALTSAKSKIKSEDKANQVISGLRDQMRFYRKLRNARKHESEWRMGMVSTWLNGERWTDEIGSHTHLADSLRKTKCKCGADTQIKTLCIDCYNKKVDHWTLPIMREYYVRNKLARRPDETFEQWRQRLVADARASGVVVRSRIGPL
jgi:hypothetical protein